MTPQTFKAIVVNETDSGRFSRSIIRKTLDDLPPGDILIRVKYTALNYKDVLSAQGNKGVTRKYPHTPGIDAAGTVEQSTCEDFCPGDSVLVTGYDLGMNTSGGFSEYIRVPENWVVPLPDPMTFKESMILGTAGFTAGLSIDRILEFGLKQGDGPVLVSGATGGVGSIAVAIMSMLGYHVTAVNGHQDRTDFLRSIGAKEVISIEDVMDNSPKPMLKERWACMVDTVGGNLLSSAIKSIKRHGIVTTCGNVGGADLNTSVYPFILRGITLSGIDSAETPMDRRLRIWEKLSGEYRVPDIEKLATEIPDLEALDEQIDRMINHKRVGRTVIKVP